MAELHLTPWQTMNVEAGRLEGSIKAILKDVSMGLQDVASIYVEPEEARDYVNISQEAACKELARLNFRAFVFPPSSTNMGYLESVLPLYGALESHFDNPEMKEAVVSFRKNVEEKLSNSRLSHILQS